MGLPVWDKQLQPGWVEFDEISDIPFDWDCYDPNDGYQPSYQSVHDYLMYGQYGLDRPVSTELTPVENVQEPDINYDDIPF